MSPAKSATKNSLFGTAFSLRYTVPPKIPAKLITKETLSILAPITLPRDNADSPENADVTPTKSSGREVVSETKTAASVKSPTPVAADSFLTDPTIPSADLRRITKRKITRMISMINIYLFCILYKDFISLTEVPWSGSLSSLTRISLGNLKEYLAV